MARPKKLGLDYFDLDCQPDDKIRLIQAQFGLTGFAIVIKLYQLIYSGLGYYAKWDEDRTLLFMSENGINANEKNLLEEIVKACIKRDIFSKDLFDKYGILTSCGIQKRYINAVSKREQIEIKKEYLLIKNLPANAKIDEKEVSVEETGVSVEKTGVSSVDNPQSRVEKSRVEKSIYKTFCAEPCNSAQQQESIVMHESENDKPDKSLKITNKGKAALTDKDNNSQIAGDESKTLISLPLNTGELYPFTDKDIYYYKDLYPAIDVLQEFRSMIGWLDSNITRRKTKSGIKRFVNSWLSKAQNSAMAGRDSFAFKAKKNAFNNFEQRNTDFDSVVAMKMSKKFGSS